MKVIEGLKQVKELLRKADDLRQKVAQHCADMENEKPVYGSGTDGMDPAGQREQVNQWIQAHTDVLREVEKLRLRIQQTNLSTMVTIKVGDNQVTKSIAAWIHRRKDLASGDMALWASLGDRNLRPVNWSPSGKIDENTRVIHVRRYFDPKLRDKMIEAYRSEPATIDATLEVVNATTDLLD